MGQVSTVVERNDALVTEEANAPLDSPVPAGKKPELQSLSAVWASPNGHLEQTEIKAVVDNFIFHLEKELQTLEEKINKSAAAPTSKETSKEEIGPIIETVIKFLQAEFEALVKEQEDAVKLPWSSMTGDNKAKERIVVGSGLMKALNNLLRKPSDDSELHTELSALLTAFEEEELPVYAEKTTLEAAASAAQGSTAGEINEKEQEEEKTASEARKRFQENLKKLLEHAKALPDKETGTSSSAIESRQLNYFELDQPDQPEQRQRKQDAAGTELPHRDPGKSSNVVPTAEVQHKNQDIFHDSNANTNDREKTALPAVRSDPVTAPHEHRATQLTTPEKTSESEQHYTGGAHDDSDWGQDHNNKQQKQFITGQKLQAMTVSVIDPLAATETDQEQHVPSEAQTSSTQEQLLHPGQSLSSSDYSSSFIQSYVVQPISGFVNGASATTFEQDTNYKQMPNTDHDNGGQQSDDTFHFNKKQQQSTSSRPSGYEINLAHHHLTAHEMYVSALLILFVVGGAFRCFFYHPVAGAGPSQKLIANTTGIVGVVIFFLLFSWFVTTSTVIGAEYSQAVNFCTVLSVLVALLVFCYLQTRSEAGSAQPRETTSISKKKLNRPTSGGQGGYGTLSSGAGAGQACRDTLNGDTGAAAASGNATPPPASTPTSLPCSCSLNAGTSSQSPVNTTCGKSDAATMVTTAGDKKKKLKIEMNADEEQIAVELLEDELYDFDDFGTSDPDSWFSQWLWRRVFGDPQDSGLMDPTKNGGPPSNAAAKGH
ncbi:unnamed protein product [Amoebophrya sp. A120]|nr:unnamed protein product [Amoebophrya sp. A120]|eukprot:GSA120T00000378001.1